MSERGSWQGMLAIARFNWPFYLAASSVAFGAGIGWLIVPSPAWRLALAAAVLGSAYFIFVSLGVSHLIYDRSDLYRWRWLQRVRSGAAPRRAIFCHCGFDEASQALRACFPGTEWLILDHYDPVHMTEPSIQRARRMFPPTRETIPAGYDQWPVAAECADIVFGILAVHELRSNAARTAWFEQARRCLRAGGRVVLVEHLRDFANFVAFGPGFLHFHARKSWRLAWEAADLRCVDAFRVTPWIGIFVLASE